MATIIPVEDRQPRWFIWHSTVCGLALLFIVFPAIMDIPHHDQINLQMTIAATKAV